MHPPFSRSLARPTHHLSSLDLLSRLSLLLPPVATDGNRLFIGHESEHAKSESALPEGRLAPESRHVFLLLQTETALIYDAVHLFAQALHDLDHSQVSHPQRRPVQYYTYTTYLPLVHLLPSTYVLSFLQFIDTKPLSCDGSDTWQHGNSLVNYMKLVEMTGLSGRIKFDQHGLRTDFRLEVVELKKDGLIKVGTWTEKVMEKRRSIGLLGFQHYPWLLPDWGELHAKLHRKLQRDCRESGQQDPRGDNYQGMHNLETLKVLLKERAKLVLHREPFLFSVAGGLHYCAAAHF